MERRFPLIAMGFAVAALAIVLIAVVVVFVRGKPASDTTPDERTVAAVDVFELQSSVVKLVVDGGKSKGLQVTDAVLAGRLGLSTDDTITSISGRTIKREFDVHEALFNTSMMKANALYIELEHDGVPVLRRWKIDGDLQAARHSSSSSSWSSPSAFGSNPDPTPDPLLDTIARLDDTHITMPRATVDALLGDPTKLTRGARLVPAVKNGSADGFKIYAIRPDSVYARLAFNNGDTIQTIDGVELSSADKALEVYTKARNATEIVVELIRRGTPMTLTITIK